MKPRRRAVTGSIAALALATLAGGQYAGATSGSGGGQTITVMIGSSGPAETAAVQAAVDAWQQASGNTVDLIAAEDMNLQLGQALAGGDPPDVFYVNADKFQEYASGGSLAAVGDQLDNPDDFYPALRQVFTYDDQLYCAPKDFSTLALVINTDAWEAAGLTDADIPETWDDLSAVAAKLTTDDQVGLATGADPRPGRRADGRRRRLLRQRGPDRGHRRHPGEPRRAASSSRACSTPAATSSPRTWTSAGAARRSAPGRRR